MCSTACKWEPGKGVTLFCFATPLCLCFIEAFPHLSGIISTIPYHWVSPHLDTYQPLLALPIQSYSAPDREIWLFHFSWHTCLWVWYFVSAPFSGTSHCLTTVMYVGINRHWWSVHTMHFRRRSDSCIHFHNKGSSIRSTWGIVICLALLSTICCPMYSNLFPDSFETYVEKSKCFVHVL